MSTLTTLREVVRWAAGSAWPDPVPQPEKPGPVAARAVLAELLGQAPLLGQELGVLAALEAAKLGWKTPPLGDATPVGYGVVLLTTALGLGDSAVAFELLAGTGEPTGAWELVLREALVGKALSGPLDGSFAQALRRCSPLTAVLSWPAAGTQDAAFALVDRLRLHPDGYRTLVRALSAPYASAAGLRFREACLERLRLLDPAGLALVLEIYEAAFVYHSVPTLSAVRQAALVLTQRDAVEQRDMEGALALAAFFGPLRQIHRGSPVELRQRPYLDAAGVRTAIDFHKLAQRMAGAAP